MGMKNKLATKGSKTKRFVFIGRVINYLRPFSFVNVIFYISIMVLLGLFFTFLGSVLFSETKSATSYIALMTASLTMTMLIYNVRRHLSEDYIKDAKEYLKRASEMLQPKDGKESPPKDRMVWLTAARFLKISERLASKIIMSSHKATFIEEKHYWKWKMKEYIQNLPPEYYPEEYWKARHFVPAMGSVLSESSVYVIHKFIEWDSDYIDPLNKSFFSEEDIHKLRRDGYVNLAIILSEVQKSREK